MPNINRGGGGTYGTLSAQITNFVASAGSMKSELTWANPSDSNFSGVIILRKTGGYPSSPSDGVRIYDGTGTTYADTGLTGGTQYYYRAFAYNAKKEYQTIYCVATATPLAGQELGSMPVGTKLKFGAIFGNPIIQEVANISGSDVALITDGVIARLTFDAMEPLNSDDNRKSTGNNRYLYSNITQWMNSTAVAGAWYSAQHSADQAPDSNHVNGNPSNPYDTWAGFLNGFTEKEIGLLKSQTITVGKATIDGGGTETLNAKIYLPSGTEVGLTTNFTEGSQLAAFTDENSRIAYETADCATNCGGTAGAACIYRLRTPKLSDGEGVESVNAAGAMQTCAASGGSIGVRPCCCLDTSVMVSMQPDSDGCYTVL